MDDLSKEDISYLASLGYGCIGSVILFVITCIIVIKSLLYI